MSIVTEPRLVTLDADTLAPLARLVYNRFLKADTAFEQAKSHLAQKDIDRGEARRALLGLLAALDVVIDEYRADPPFTVTELGRISDLSETEWGQVRTLSRMANAQERTTR